jgi:hypothetical protein
VTATRKAIHPKPALSKALATALALMGLLLLSPAAHGFSKTLLIGPDVGYSGTFLSKKTFPYVFDGVSLGAHLTYGITSFFGVDIEGAFDLHKDYQTLHEDVVENEDGTVGWAWIKGPKITKYYLTSWAASLVYALDVLRVVPYLTAGATGARIDRRWDGKHRADYEVGLRLGIGFDFGVFKYFGLGAIVFSDWYYKGTSNHNRRVAFMLRISLAYDFSKPKKFGMTR